MISWSRFVHSFCTQCTAAFLRPEYVMMSSSSWSLIAGLAVPSLPLRAMCGGLITLSTSPLMLPWERDLPPTPPSRPLTTYLLFLPSLFPIVL